MGYHHVMKSVWVINVRYNILLYGWGQIYFIIDPNKQQ